MTQTTHEERLEVYKEALWIFGQETQLVVALEELSEIQKEICKALRGFVNPAQLAEEVADATIMLEQLRYIFGIGPAVDQMVDTKIRRLVQRIEEAKEQKRMFGKRIMPTPGTTYINKNGGAYLCGVVWKNDTPEPSYCASMTNIASGWTFIAHGITQYADGSIEWDYSTGGRFGEIPE